MRAALSYVWQMKRGQGAEWACVPEGVQDSGVKEFGWLEALGVLKQASVWVSFIFSFKVLDLRGDRTGLVQVTGSTVMFENWGNIFPVWPGDSKQAAGPMRN